MTVNESVPTDEVVKWSPSRRDLTFTAVGVASVLLGYFFHLWPLFVVYGLLLVEGLVRHRRRLRMRRAITIAAASYGLIWLIGWLVPWR